VNYRWTDLIKCLVFFGYLIEVLVVFKLTSCHETDYNLVHDVDLHAAQIAKIEHLEKVQQLAIMNLVSYFALVTDLL